MFPAPAVARGAHLYVMQSASGRIKIGRSSDPERRRRAFEASSGQRIFVCLIVRGAGDSERSVHAACSAYRMMGEWFQHTREARDAIIASVGCHIRFPVLLHQEMSDREAETSETFRRLAAQIEAEGPYRGRRRKRILTPPLPRQ